MTLSSSSSSQHTRTHTHTTGGPTRTSAIRVVYLVVRVMEFALDASNYKPGVRRIDENKLNALLDSVSAEEASKIIQRALPEPSKRRPIVRRGGSTPNSTTVNRIVIELGLLDEPDYERRAKVFIGYCRVRDYAINTVKQYFKIARQLGTFGPPGAVSIRPDPSVFSGRTHTRIVSNENFVSLFKFLMDGWSEYTAPLLVAFYTGLRTMEILQFTGFTLHQLLARQPTVNVKRKQTAVSDEPVYWRPVYTTYLRRLVDKLALLYASELEAYASASANVSLFYVTPKTLANRIRLAYYKANGSCPPLGFGVHSCRNMLASIMAETSKCLPAIQLFLQHKSPKTTNRYIKTDLNYIRDQFNRITGPEFTNVRLNLTRAKDSAALPAVPSE